MESKPSSVRLQDWERKLIENRGIKVSDVLHYGARCLIEGVVHGGGIIDVNVHTSGQPAAPRPASAAASIDALAAASRTKTVDKTTRAGPCRIGILARADRLPGPGGARKMILINDCTGSDCSKICDDQYQNPKADYISQENQ